MTTSVGSYAPLLTPLTPDGSIDFHSARRLVRHALDGGCAGVLALGSSGENAAIGRSRRRVMLAATAAAISDYGCGELLVGVAQCSVDEALEEIANAALTGAQAVVVAPPYYGSCDESALERFYRHLAEGSSLPVLAYNIPAFTGVQVPADLVVRLCLEGVLAGVKDSGRDLEYLQQVLRGTVGLAEVSVFTGTDSFIATAAQLGAAGAISIAANIAPRWTADLYRLASDPSASVAEVMDLQRRVTELALGLRRGDFPSGAKAAAMLLGLCDVTIAPPGAAAGPDDLTALTELLERTGVLRPASADSLHDVGRDHGADDVTTRKDTAP